MFQSAFIIFLHSSKCSLRIIAPELLFIVQHKIQWENVGAVHNTHYSIWYAKRMQQVSKNISSNANNKRSVKNREAWCTEIRAGLRPNVTVTMMLLYMWSNHYTLIAEPITTKAKGQENFCSWFQNKRRLRI